MVLLQIKYTETLKAFSCKNPFRNAGVSVFRRNTICGKDCVDHTVGTKIPSAHVTNDEMGFLFGVCASVFIDSTSHV